MTQYQDIIEIEQLIFRCCHAVDQGHIDDLMQLFHPYANLHITWETDGVHVGQDAVKAWFENYKKAFVDQLDFVRHRVTSPMIRVQGDKASARSYLNVDTGNRATGAAVTLARYEDKFVKEEGRWWFIEKVVFMDGLYPYAAG